MSWRWAATVVSCVLALPAAVASSAAAASFYLEAPELAEQVRANALPPVDRRLPANPLLLQPEERVGRYGGTWTMGLVGGNDGLLVYRSIGYEPLVRWDPAWKRVIPNVAQSFHVNADATEFTFRLRSGLRWSDGHPFTAEDVVFWFEDVLCHPELAALSQRWHRNGPPERVEAVDRETVRFVFKSPNSLFLLQLAVGQVERGPTDYPKHALKRFHKRYADASLEAEVKAAGVKDWTELFALKSQGLRNSSVAGDLLRRAGVDAASPSPVEAAPIPTLEAWTITRLEPAARQAPVPPQVTAPHVVATRNPYYWKVDPAGRQLPYIDRVEFALLASNEQVLDMALTGRIGMQARSLASLFYRDAALLGAVEKAGYRPIELISADSNVLPIMLNLTHSDPAKRALYASHDFRVALSLAIDRAAVIKGVFHGEGEPYQVAPRPESRFFSADMARQYIAHDPEEAGSRLDALGLTRRDTEGFRLNPDGARVGLTVLARRDRPEFAQALALIAAQWRAVGVDLTVREVDRAVMLAAVRKNDFDAVIGHAEGAFDAILDAFAYIPITPDSYFAPAWVRWLVDPNDPLAQEPPATVAHQIHLYDRIRTTVEPDQQDRFMREALVIAQKEFYVMGVALPGRRHGVARDDFHNVPRVMFEAWQYPTPGPTNTSQYFIEPREPRW